MAISRYIFFGACLLFAFSSHAQKHDQVWLFGYQSNSTTPGVEGVSLDFQESPPIVSSENFNYSINVSNASICDKEGNLLFYTNGCSVIQANHEIMQNGHGLNPGDVHDSYCENGYPGGTQSCLILPHPVDSSLYFLFHKHVSLQIEPEFNVISDQLLVTQINASSNNGQGEVLEKNNILFEGLMTFGQLTAVQHANGSDWWILTGGDQNNEYYKFILSVDGPIFHSAQEIGAPSSSLGSEGGQATFCPDGSCYVRFSAPDGIFLFDFDRESGLLSNFQQIPIEDESSFGGVAISPNSRFLYVFSELYAYQFDLETEDISNSRVTVAEFDGFQSPFPTFFFRGN